MARVNNGRNSRRKNALDRLEVYLANNQHYLTKNPLNESSVERIKQEIETLKQRVIK